MIKEEIREIWAIGIWRSLKIFILSHLTAGFCVNSHILKFILQQLVWIKEIRIHGKCRDSIVHKEVLPFFWIL